MESSQVFGNAEECNSSESGWTTYICSPITNNDEGDEVDRDHDLTDHDGDTNDHDGVHDVNKHDEDDHESDDSMASDASSGPTHRGNYSWGNGKDEGKKKHRSKKKAKYPLEKNGTKQEKEEGSVFTAKGASVEIRSSEEKVRKKKNTWFGKRK